MTFAENNLISCSDIIVKSGEPIWIANQIKNRNKKIPKKRAIQRSMVIISFNSIFFYDLAGFKVCLSSNITELIFN